MIVDGQPSKPRAVNVVGLRRHDFSEDDIHALTEAFRILYRQRAGVEVAREQLMTRGPIRPVLKQLFEFLDHSGGGRHGRGRDRRKKKAA